jgi:hypothetical protein
MARAIVSRLNCALGSFLADHTLLHCPPVRESAHLNREGPGMTIGGYVLIAFAVIGILVGAWIAPEESNLGFVDAAAVLAFAGLAAVAIERTIEGFFTIVGSRWGQWWPLSVVSDELTTFETQTNKLLNDVVEDAKSALAQARQAVAAGSDEATEIQAALVALETKSASLKKQFQNAQNKLAPGSSRVQRIADVASDAHAELTNALATAKGGTTAAAKVLEQTADAADQALLIIASFEDNPARRLAGLAMGAALGSIVAGGVGLNIFSATLAPAGAGTTDWTQLLLGGAGMALTGIIIGLGSAPTHEVIKALQEYKKGRKGSEVAPRPGAEAEDGAEGVPAQKRRQFREILLQADYAPARIALEDAGFNVVGDEVSYVLPAREAPRRMQRFVAVRRTD